jgi:hypothetical protein
MTGVALGGVLLGAALLSTGTANADQVAGGGRQVVFAGGGMLNLSCESTPSVESMTVPADATVRVVNRIGHGAQLLINGASKGFVPDNGSTEVVFRRGTTAVMLDPNCPISDQAMPVLITVTPPPAPADPDPIPVPSDSDPSGTPAAPAHPGTPSVSAGAGGSSLPDSVSPATRPTRTTTTGAGRPATAPPNTSPAGTVAAAAATTAAQAMPQGGAPIRLKTRTGDTVTAVLPAFSGMPPGDDKAILPGVPTLDLPSTTTEAAPAVPTAPPSDIAAAEPVAAMEPVSESRPIGLLALIASVCVVGVGVGAIRAIVSQRASRSSVA